MNHPIFPSVRPRHDAAPLSQKIVPMRKAATEASLAISSRSAFRIPRKKKKTTDGQQQRHESSHKIMSVNRTSNSTKKKHSSTEPTSVTPCPDQAKTKPTLNSLCPRRTGHASPVCKPFLQPRKTHKVVIDQSESSNAFPPVPSCTRTKMGVIFSDQFDDATEDVAIAGNDNNDNTGTGCAAATASSVLLCGKDISDPSTPARPTGCNLTVTTSVLLCTEELFDSTPAIPSCRGSPTQQHRSLLFPPSLPPIRSPSPSLLNQAKLVRSRSESWIATTPKSVKKCKGGNNDKVKNHALTLQVVTPSPGASKRKRKGLERQWTAAEKSTHEGRHCAVAAKHNPSNAIAINNEQFTTPDIYAKSSGKWTSNEPQLPELQDDEEELCEWTNQGDDLSCLSGHEVNDEDLELSELGFKFFDGEGVDWPAIGDVTPPPSPKSRNGGISIVNSAGTMVETTNSQFKAAREKSNDSDIDRSDHFDTSIEKLDLPGPTPPPSPGGFFVPHYSPIVVPTARGIKPSFQSYAATTSSTATTPMPIITENLTFSLTASNIDTSPPPLFEDEDDDFLLVAQKQAPMTFSAHSPTHTMEARSLASAFTPPMHPLDSMSFASDIADGAF